MRLDATQFNYCWASTGDASKLILLGTGLETKERAAVLTQPLYAALLQHLIHNSSAFISTHGVFRLHLDLIAGKCRNNWVFIQCSCLCTAPQTVQLFQESIWRFKSNLTPCSGMKTAHLHVQKPNFVQQSLSAISYAAGTDITCLSAWFLCVSS